MVSKIELHCHLDGVLDPAMLEEITLSLNRPLPLSIESLKSVYPINSWSDWNQKYQSCIEPVLNDFDIQLAMAKVHINRLKNQNVRYAEIFVSGHLSGSDFEAKFEKLNDLIYTEAQKEFQIELVVAMGRGSPEKIARRIEKVIHLHKKKLICGMAIAGDESACSIESIKASMDKVKNTGMGIEIHSGETLGPDAVWDALKFGHPDRIGHGLSIFKDPVLIEEVQRKNLHIEFCPTSNLKLVGLGDIKDHPLKIANERKMNFSINTDDPGPLNCSMESEFNLLRKELTFTDDDFRRIYENSWSSRFAGR